LLPNNFEKAIMAAKYIELKQAAELLGVSEDKLNDMRLRGDILAVRDGSSWKFKEDELQRVADDLGISLGGAEDGGDEESDLALDVEGDEFDTAPTEIGSAADFAAELDADDDLDLAADGDSEAGKPSSDVSLVPDAEGSGLNLVADDSAGDILAGSDVSLDSSGTGGLGTGELEFEGSDLDLGSDINFDDGDELALDEDSGDEITLGKDEEELALTDDDELVLDGGSDVTGGAGDTGINLTSPSDSGLNLEEEPLELAGSSVSSLELPEDDELGDLEDLDAAAGGSDEDFQLEPSAALDDDEDDSGSQVIALEDSEAFAESAALVDDDAVLGAEPVDELEGALDEEDASPVTQPALPDSAYAAGPPETPYSIWNVLSLVFIALLLAITGMLMTDLVRNMWTWDQPYSASTPIMDLFIRIAGFDP
jgi:excisionase family DNA binding protein